MVVVLRQLSRHTEQRMVFFVTAGPDPGEANRLLESIYRVFGP